MLKTLIALFQSGILDIWSKVSMSFNTIINTLLEDEVTMIGQAKEQFLADLDKGLSWGDAAANLWTFVENYEKAELSKVGRLLLEAFVASLEPKAA